MGETLREVTIADLAAVLAELERFWGGRDVAFLHQALYVHEFGETSVLAEGADGCILGYLLGFVSQDGAGYVHVVAVRREARRGSRGADASASRSSCAHAVRSG